MSAPAGRDARGIALGFYSRCEFSVLCFASLDGCLCAFAARPSLHRRMSPLFHQRGRGAGAAARAAAAQPAARAARAQPARWHIPQVYFSPLDGRASGAAADGPGPRRATPTTAAPLLAATAPPAPRRSRRPWEMLFVYGPSHPRPAPSSAEMITSLSGDGQNGVRPGKPD